MSSIRAVSSSIAAVLGITATQYELCGPLGRAAGSPHECWQDGGHGQLVPCTEITERLAPSVISRTLAGVQTCHEESPGEHDQHG